jgi:hypothetical protein
MIADRFTRRQSGADALVAGHYLIRRDRQQRVPLPVHIWFGPPVDLETGISSDRSWRWQISVAGVTIDDEPVRIGSMTMTCLTDIWPACARHPISREEHDFMIARAQWAGEYDPTDPFGDTSAKIDPETSAIPFLDEAA